MCAFFLSNNAGIGPKTIQRNGLYTLIHWKQKTNFLPACVYYICPSSRIFRESSEFVVNLPDFKNKTKSLQTSRKISNSSPPSVFRSPILLYRTVETHKKSPNTTHPQAFFRNPTETCGISRIRNSVVGRYLNLRLGDSH